MHPTDFRTGDRVLLRNVERFPHFFLEGERTGTVVDVNPSCPEAGLSVRVDTLVPNCREWSNEVVFGVEMGLNGESGKPEAEIEGLGRSPMECLARMPKHVETKAHVRAFLHAMFDLVDLGFHPDDDALEYTHADGATPLLGEAEAIRVNALLAELHAWGVKYDVDVYHLAIRIARERQLIG